MKIALLGFGVVGQGFYEIFADQKQSLIDEFNQPIEIGKVLIRPNEQHENFKVLSFTDRFEDILSYKPDVVISAMGGITPAFTYASKVMANGSSFITSNKDLIASHYDELHQIAKKNNVRLLFEASVAGTIPLIKTIREDLRGNTFKGFEGIVNGTTNYILSSMSNDKIDYSEALLRAQNKGFAESDPTSDVEGKDAIRKTTILVNQLFKQSFVDKDISGSGITKLPQRMIEFTQNNDAKIKLLAYAFRRDQKIYANVRPVIVCSSHPLYYVDYEMNEVSIEGHACGKIRLNGSGAGKLTTGSAVFSDLYDFMLKPNQVTYYNPVEALTLDNSYETNAYFLPHKPLKPATINALIGNGIIFNTENGDSLIKASGEYNAKEILESFSESEEVYIVLR
ncbi:MAG: homoserine dehydrogenase [Clostridiales bacterium]|nr:homoserine dehydrogenase [Clostridiales bacterium]